VEKSERGPGLSHLDTKGMQQGKKNLGEGDQWEDSGRGKLTPLNCSNSTPLKRGERRDEEWGRREHKEDIVIKVSRY